MTDAVDSQLGPRRASSPAPGVSLEDWMAVVRHLIASGVLLSVRSGLGGWRSASPVGLLVWLVDPAAAEAAEVGMTREEYSQFHKAEGVIACCGTTIAGKPCRNIKHEICHDPQRWLELNRAGWRCPSHRGSRQ